jgi:hypothetical protein
VRATGLLRQSEGKAEEHTDRKAGSREDRAALAHREV